MLSMMKCSGCGAQLRLVVFMGMVKAVDCEIGDEAQPWPDQPTSTPVEHNAAVCRFHRLRNRGVLDVPRALIEDVIALYHRPSTPALAEAAQRGADALRALLDTKALGIDPTSGDVPDALRSWMRDG